MERAFSLSKRCYGMGLIVTKLEETQLTTIALSVFVTNLFKLQRRMHSAYKLYILSILRQLFIQAGKGIFAKIKLRRVTIHKIS